MDSDETRDALAAFYEAVNDRVEQEASLSRWYADECNKANQDYTDARLKLMEKYIDNKSKITFPGFLSPGNNGGRDN